MAKVLGDDDVPHPSSLVTKPAMLYLQNTALVVAQSATVYAILTDATGWTEVARNLTAALGGWAASAAELVAGQFKAPRAMKIKVSYRISGITVINGSTRQAKIFGGAAGTTDKGGDSLATDLTAGPSTLAGFSIFDVAAGDLVSIKTIESGAGNMTVAALGASILIEEV